MERFKKKIKVTGGSLRGGVSSKDPVHYWLVRPALFLGEFLKKYSKKPKNGTLKTLGPCIKTKSIK